MDSCLKGKAQSLIQFLLGSHTSSRCEEDPAILPCYTPVEKPLGLLPSSFLLYYWQSQKSRVIPFGLRTHPFLSFCPVLLSSPNCALCPLTQCTVTGNFCVFKLLWTPPALCYFDSLPNTGLAFSLSSGSVFCPTSLLPEPWVLNSVTSSQFLPPASAIHVCGSVHSGLKTWVQSQRATQWKERIYSCELFSDLYMTSVACVFLASVQTTCLLVQTYMEAKYQYT